MPIEGTCQRCRQCGEYKLLGEFRAMERLPRKIVGTCKACEALMRRERRKMVKARERRGVGRAST